MKRRLRSLLSGQPLRASWVVWAALGLAGCGASDDPNPEGESQGGNSPQSGGSGTKGGSSSGQGSAGRPAGGGGKSAVDSGFPDAQEYVDAHSKVRAAVQKPANYAGNWEPLPNVGWSDEVAATAQEWADHLRDSMGCDLEYAQGSGYGENLAGGTSLGAKQAVELWASEIDNYAYQPKYVFESDTGHYTQIVWRKSTSIGCARAECGRSAVVVCRYDPPGNFIGGSIF